ncbi:carboxypeptidase-like regulatory domain-containing protein [Pedobacter sp. AW1-32]|uniref:carboxypeptidase-like regulatory domain-containing protein n=1 Tax=Pedobacter sp. AW1-32 TaxID=3383026 RepID=UPI003FF0AB60
MKFSYYFLTAAILALSFSSVRAQYVEPEEKEKVTNLFPEVPFDSLGAKKMLARGTGTISGVAFTKPKTKLGYKAPLASRIYANKIKIVLLPVTPYFEAWYKLRDDKENKRKKIFVYMTPQAFKYRLEAITNSNGKFTFPEMKPGKYFLQGFLGWTSSGTYNEYTGSGYNNYGGRTDYYQQKGYSVSHEDRLETFVEVKSDGEVVNIKLK